MQPRCCCSGSTVMCVVCDAAQGGEVRGGSSITSGGVAASDTAVQKDSRTASKVPGARKLNSPPQPCSQHDLEAAHAVARLLGLWRCRLRGAGKSTSLRHTHTPPGGAPSTMCTQACGLCAPCRLPAVRASRGVTQTSHIVAAFLSIRAVSAQRLLPSRSVCLIHSFHKLERSRLC